jgi:hypothetical protein
MMDISQVNNFFNNIGSNETSSENLSAAKALINFKQQPQKSVTSTPSKHGRKKDKAQSVDDAYKYIIQKANLAVYSKKTTEKDKANYGLDLMNVKINDGFLEFFTEKEVGDVNRMVGKWALRLKTKKTSK